MFAIVLIDHRLALLALAALLIAAAARLGYAWARLLPEEPPPFEVAAAGPPAEDLASNPTSPAKKNLLAVFLLVCVTLSYILRFPGLPLATALRWLATLLPADYFHWTVLAGRTLCMVAPGEAVGWYPRRPNPLPPALRVGAPLCLAAVLARTML